MQLLLLLRLLLLLIAPSPDHISMLAVSSKRTLIIRLASQPSPMAILAWLAGMAWPGYPVLAWLRMSMESVFIELTLVLLGGLGLGLGVGLERGLGIGIGFHNRRGLAIADDRQSVIVAAASGRQNVTVTLGLTCFLTLILHAFLEIVNFINSCHHFLSVVTSAPQCSWILWFHKYLESCWLLGFWLDSVARSTISSTLIKNYSFLLMGSPFLNSNTK